MSTTYQDVDNAAQAQHLCVRGGVHPPDMNGIATVILLGPDEPEFWPAFTNSPEYKDSHPNPMDRWSTRVVMGLADQLGAMAYFPFGGPPFSPFLRWALQSGRAWSSPINLLAHDTAGLFVSYRGALGFAHHIPLPPAPDTSPCTSCEAPCKTACPVDAFSSGLYDVPRCKAYLGTDAGQACMEQGCAARRACPISKNHGRLAEQSAFHMRAFL